MAKKKKKKAHRARTRTATVTPGSIATERDEEPEETVAAASKPKKEARDSGKSKEKDSSKGKDKKVVKSQARAKDPKKSTKKPNIFRRFIEYIKQVRLEIKRTTWPTKNEVLNMTIIVLVALLFFGVLIFVIDLIMVQLLNLYAQLAPDVTILDSSVADATTGGE